MSALDVDVGLIATNNILERTHVNQTLFTLVNTPTKHNYNTTAMDLSKFELNEISSRYWMGKSTTNNPQQILKNPNYEIYFFKNDIGRKFNKLHTHPCYGNWSVPHYYTFLFLVKFKRKRKYFGVKHFKNQPPWFPSKIKTNFLHSAPKKINKQGFDDILSYQQDKQKIHFVKGKVAK